MSQHVEQPKQALFQQLGRQLEEEIGVSLAGGGIQLPAATLYERHQALFRQIAIATEKQQMLEKMRKPWIGCRRIVRARVYPYQCGGLGTAPPGQQAYPQPARQVAQFRAFGDVVVHGASIRGFRMAALP